MKLHVSEMKQEYLQTIREESENRRNNFYNSNIKNALKEKNIPRKGKIEEETYDS